ncbi:MAG: hypothetical protein A2X19_07205 [Bacteroidetes bacterium GWE2_39_28]|nr:MAG: hypothetical protein A2X19_07205 [Bacteroidetes bacterium GWE2_39_28]OFY11586.1 MAG: hypothetical protein A2X16_10390 [Bacteroidetes bacterium GWF2_39_10]OFZ09095.1 MAG: hypothetical protein A2322_04000 [Bacteroidetes bacterium RIFOXYB2_FULL_39_7]OFZ10831.1 MAG: hypothetical protein A2465_00020 [Bacteroidetes bacterium RIFOXYC2_FULL_39_11]HCV15757.1 hypothetical protein [Rikenellaceae bacterium]
MEQKNNTTKGKETISPTRSSKRRAVVSYANLSPELLAAFKDKYPRGYADYMGEVFKVDKPDGSFFYAISLEVPDAIYLVKVDVKIDDYEDLERGLFGNNNDDEGSDPDEFPEDDSASTFSEEEESDD